MPRPRKQDKPAISAKEIYAAIDTTVLFNAVQSIIGQGGALMFGQTRDNSKLIITVYLDGDQDKEYCDDAKSAVDFLSQYQV